MENDFIDVVRWKIICRLMASSGYTRAKAELAAAQELGEFIGVVGLMDHAENSVTNI